MLYSIFETFSVWLNISNTSCMIIGIIQSIVRKQKPITQIKDSPSTLFRVVLWNTPQSCMSLYSDTAPHLMAFLTAPHLMAFLTAPHLMAFPPTHTHTHAYNHTQWRKSPDCLILKGIKTCLAVAWERQAGIHIHFRSFLFRLIYYHEVNTTL